MNLEPGISIEQFHSIVTFIWGLICLLMGVTLLVFNIPEKETTQTYRVSVRILSINYLILSVLVFCMVLLDLRNSPDDIFPFPILLICTSQGLILVYALVSLYTPKNFIRKNMLFYNIIPFFSLIVFYALSVLILGDPVCESIPGFFSSLAHPTIMARLLLLLFNVYQIVYYNAMLQKLSARYTQHLDQYYADTVQLKPRWAKNNFYFAILIGISALVSSLFKNVLIDSIFTIVFCIYYFVFAIRYMQYKDIFVKLEPEFIEDLTRNQPVENATGRERKPSGFNWGKVKSRIIDQKLYLQSGITVNDMAKLFCTNRTTFSTLLNKNEKQSFNLFINVLRIEYAQYLILENQELTLAEISQQCGYTEQSNFTRWFKKLSNETPAVWAKTQKENAKE